MNKNKFILVFLFIILFAINYNFLNNLLVESFDSHEIVFVERVVDGDTVIINGSSVRLLGINTPEKGETLSSEAKSFLESKVLDRALILDKRGQDRYYRDLAYLHDFESGDNINLGVVREGYGNFYFPSGKDEYYDDFFNAWQSCLIENKNLCEKSNNVCSGCIALKEWDAKKDKLVLENICSFDCSLDGWDLKDEGRKHFVFENYILGSREEVSITKEDFGESYVWTDSGDSLFLRDEFGKLVLWKSY